MGRKEGAPAFGKAGIACNLMLGIKPSLPRTSAVLAVPVRITSKDLYHSCLG